MFDKIHFFAQIVWQKTKKKQRLFWQERCFFLLLRMVSWFYALGFYISINIRKKKTVRKFSRRCKIISVGNISLGGTGKTPFTHWLMTHLTNYEHMPVLRGYRGFGATNAPLHIVFDKKKGLVSSLNACGDEAFLAAKKFRHKW